MPERMSIWKRSGAARFPQPASRRRHEIPPPPPGQRIAIARDAAFFFPLSASASCLARGRRRTPLLFPSRRRGPGRELRFLLACGRLSRASRGAYRGGASFLEGLRSFARTRPVHGECGGYMVLGDGLVDAEGQRHAMAGLLRLETSFSQRKLALGYRRAALAAPHRARGRRRASLRPRVSLRRHIARGRRAHSPGSGTPMRRRPAPAACAREPSAAPSFTCWRQKKGPPTRRRPEFREETPKEGIEQERSRCDALFIMLRRTNVKIKLHAN